MPIPSHSPEVLRGLIQELKSTGYFDPEWYQATYPDVAMTGLTAAEHFIRFGGPMLRDPGPNFATQTYLERCPSAQDFDFPPVIHYARFNSSMRQAFERLQHMGGPIDLFGRGMPKPKWHAGGRKRKPDVPTILYCAHASGKTLFGGERSFLDVLDALVSLDYNVITTLPTSENATYLNEVSARSVGTYTFRYPIWNLRRPSYGWLVSTFSDLMAREAIDLVHVNTIMHLEALNAAKRMGLPSVVHVRELISLDSKLREDMRMETAEIVQETLERASHIIGNSQKTCDLFSKTGRTFYVCNSVDVNKLEMDNVFGTGIKFGIVSSNVPKKGIADFVEVAKRSAKDAPRAQFVVVGPITDQIKGWKDEITKGLRPANLSFVGYVESPREAMKQFHVLLNLSNFAESFGRTVAEAMAAKRPVIAYDWGALSELVSDGKTGFLAPFRDVEAVVGCIRKLCENDALIGTMGKAGQDRIRNQFSPTVMRNALQRTYQEILKTKKPLNDPAQSVSVVVPVFNAAEELEACIDSVVRHTCLKTSRIIIVDDASTDPQIAEILRRYSQNPSFLCRTNKKNIGYTASVNFGLELAEQDDVVLLNSDTRVTPQWLEGLRSAAYIDHRVATATAMSDNAGAFSFPDFNKQCSKPDNISDEEYALTVLQETQTLIPPDVPTGSGFAMYIRRKALNEIGNFDTSAFPRGYGEENDLCMRALGAGWRNVVSPWSFIYHSRNASFGTEKAELLKNGLRVIQERFPEYDSLVRTAFASQNMQEVRNAVQVALTKLPKI